MLFQGWKVEFQAEIDRAEAARQAGNEGMARVCARRAAGIAAREFLKRQGKTLPGSSAYDILKFLGNHSGVSPRIQEVASHFLVRITTDHKLPVEADLIQEAKWLLQQLHGD